MTVSKIEPSRHVKGRILVYLDSGDMLKATEQEALTFSLYPGRVLSAEELRALRAAAGRSGARNRAAEMIGVRALSKKELCRRLIQKGESEEDACAAADWLEEIGLLNDGEFAKTLARHYAGKGYGEHKIKRELSLRGVPKEYWAAALAELGDPGAALDAFLAKKLAGRSFDDPTELKKVSDALLRRGYSWRHISEALRRHGAEIEDPGS